MNVYDTEEITHTSTKLYGISAYDTTILYIIKKSTMCQYNANEDNVRNGLIVQKYRTGCNYLLRRYL